MEASRSDFSDAAIGEIIQIAQQVHGFDFTEYAKASLKRRIIRVGQLKNMNFYDLKHALVNDQQFFKFFLEEITVNVTEMFRDPLYYLSLKEKVLPYLASYPQIKIWSAGCSTGEEAYSLNILIQDANLKSKTFIYGTDVNEEVIKTARKGIYSLEKIKGYAENYRTTTLSGSLTDHFTMMYGAAVVCADLKQNTFFSTHNLVADGVFNEFQLITCRNVFIYFESPLQEKVLRLFYKSLCPLGFLWLGSKEVIRSDFFKERFRVVDAKHNIYQKINLL
jgi:chemotaxis protein methyltransferase CheR